MRITNLLNKPAEWMQGGGPESDIVISSRIRLARNLRGYPFPGWAKKELRAQVVSCIRPALEDIPEMSGAFAEEMTQLSALEKQVLVERHLISREHAAKGPGCAVVINDQQSLSIMVNEEDHLRMQAILPGQQLMTAYRALDQVDSELETRLPYAFDPDYGYLTCCPTNLGTGLRASVMLHLPGLFLSDQMTQTMQGASKIGLAVRGQYGEGTDALANLFQISNQNTLGAKEEDIIAHLERVIEQLLRNEKNARLKVLEDHAAMIQDQIGRAYAVLKYAHIVSSKEALTHLSMIRLGCDMNVFPTEARGIVTRLLTAIQPAHLQITASTKLSMEERDVLRAEIIQENLKALTPPDFRGIIQHRDNENE